MIKKKKKTGNSGQSSGTYLYSQDSGDRSRWTSVVEVNHLFISWVHDITGAYIEINFDLLKNNVGNVQYGFQTSSVQKYLTEPSGYFIM